MTAAGSGVAGGDLVAQPLMERDRRLRRALVVDELGDGRDRGLAERGARGRAAGSRWLRRSRREGLVEAAPLSQVAQVGMLGVADPAQRREVVVVKAQGRRAERVRARGASAPRAAQRT
jgi:hypothetical protein